MNVVKNMKKLVAALFLCMIIIFSGCSKSESGSVAELTQRRWSAELEGGGEASLSFSGERAELVLSSGGEREVIEGEYIADESAFVIFDKQIFRNYSFTYVPHGENLELTFEGGTIEMTADNE